MSKLPRATLEQKIAILDYYHASQRPQADTVERFKTEVAISTLTFNEWVKREKEYRQQYGDLDSTFEKNKRRKTRYKYDQINRAMDLLVRQKLAAHEPLTEPVLRGYWQAYARQFGVDDPKRLSGFSHGWLAHFKRRHGLMKSARDQNLDVTCSTNEKLLGGDSEPSNPSLVAGAPNSGFMPHDSLSFPPFSRRPEASSESPDASVPSANDIERFIAHADRFFHTHRYDYPQTVKTYHEFKQAFLSERLIDLKSTERLIENPNSNRAASTLPPALRERPRHLATYLLPHPPLRPEPRLDVFRLPRPEYSKSRELWEQNKVLM